MKKINLIGMLQGCSKRNGTAVYASNPDGQPTVNRQSRLTSYPGEMNEKEQMSSTCPRFALVLPSFCSRLDSLSLVSRQSDLDQVRAVSVGLSARTWKHVAMIFAVLVMSMANIGMAWGDVVVWESDFIETITGVTQTKAKNTDTWGNTSSLSWAKDTYANCFNATSSSSVLTLTFSSPLSLQSGDILHLYWGCTSNRTLSLKVNGSPVSWAGKSAVTTSGDRSKIWEATYTFGANTSLSSFAVGTSGSGTYFFHVSITRAGSCSATANAGADKSTTVGVGVAMAATAASSGYTGAWSIKAGSPSTATSQLSSTSSATATFTPTAAGTYTLVWTVTDNSDGSCSATDEATVTVSAPVVTHDITYTNLKGADNSANPTTYTEGVGVASFANLRHVVGYDFTGWSPSSISSSATTDQTIDAQWTARAAAAGTGTLTYALAFGTSTITTSSITRNNSALYDATDVSIAHTTFNDGAAKNGCSGKLTTTSAKDASNYVELTFKIADGYTFTPTEVQVRGNAVSTAKTMEVELKDNAATPNTKSVSGSLAEGSTSGGSTVTLDFDASGTVTLEGTVTLKIFVYGATNHWRLGTSIIVNGTVASATSDAYDIHIGKNNADYTDESLTNTSGTTWSKTITLDAGSYYEFKVKKTPSAGDAVWYGNNGKITATTSPAWDFNTSDGNCKLYTSIAGSYTFSWDASTNKLTVNYPAGDHPTKRIYMACGSGTWCDASPKFFVHSWGVTDYNTQVQQNACGEYYADIIWYNDYFQFTRNSSAATAYDDNQWNVSQDLTYNSSQLLWTFSGWSDSKGNFSSSAYSPTTYTISYNAGTGGSGSKASESKTCGVAFTLPNSAVFTRTGYTQTGWTTSDGGAQEYALGGTYTTNATQTFYPVWTPIQYDVTLEKGSAPAAGSSGSAKVYYDAAALTNISHATWAGHVLTGYYTSNSGGTKVLNADGSFAAANVSGYITDNKWTRAENTTLRAQWTCAALTLVLDGDAATPAGGSPIGTEYTLTCSASTGAIASYQWKQNTTASTTGAVDAEGTGATTASFSPVPAAAGTYYYYCVATDACDNSVNTSFSGAFTFTAPVVPYATSIDFEAIIDESGTGAAWKTTMEGRNYTLTQADGSKWSLDGGDSGNKPADKGLKIKETGDNAGKITFTVRANQTVELKVGTLAGTGSGVAKFSTDGGSSYSNITGAATASTGASVVTTYTGATDRTYVFKTNSASWNILQHIIIGYKITYDKGANGTGTIDPMYKTHGTNINLSSSTFTYAGHTQDGWSTSDGGSKVYELGASYTSDAPITLYPHWVEDVVVPTITATKTSPDYVTTDPNNVVLSISTTGASAGWYYRVKNTGTAGYQTPDNTPYNTATWTMTSGLSLGVNNFVVELYNGSGVKQAESGTITVTAETAYPITIAAGAGGSVSPSGEIKANESGNHIHPTITATPSSGYHFVNWTLSNANATVADASSATTTISNAVGACTITANFEEDAPVATPMITWNLNVGTSASTTLKSSTSTTDGTNITNIDIDQTNDGANGAGASDRTTKLALATGTTASAVAEPDKYEVFTFKVACGKKVTPSEVKIKVANVGSSAGGNQNYKAVLSDTYGHSISNTFTGTKGDGTVEEFSITNGGGTYFQGDVTLKLWSCKGADGNASAFRMGTPLEIYGEVANQATPAATITWTTQPANGQVGDPDFAYAVSCSDGSAVTVTSANTTYATIVGGKLHYVAAGTTHLVASATDACGNTVTPVNSNDFTVSAAAPTHDVTFSLTNVVYSSGNNQGTGAATEGSAFSTVFAASSGYSLPGTITVTIGGVAQTAGTGYTWAQGSGTLTIPAAYVTGDIVVTIVGEEMEGDGCDELVHTEAATATSLSTSVGTATLYNPSSQSKNSKAIKLNSSGYIELSPKAGKSFAAGDSLIVVVYNQATSGKTTGFKIGTDTYTASIAASSNHTFRQKLTADNIVSSKVKIERESSDGWFVSIIIKHCEDLPSCTTPTLPSLSDQELCPGSDIAAWDATPTNIATITGASEDVAYSWKKKGSDTELAATASFDLGSSATEGMAGTYVVTVTVSKTGYITKSASAEVDLTVTPATETPSVTASKAKVYATDEVTLTATCGSTGVTWNWYLCANSDGTGAGSSLGTSATYTIASAPAAGTYYYKAVATGDGTHSCGTAEYVYTLVVSAANSCDKEFWFAKEGDRPTGAAAATHITGCPSGSSSASYTASIDGTNYTLTGSTGQKTGNVTIVVPADNTGTLYVVVQGSSSRTITLSKGGTQIGQETPANSTWGVFTFDDLDAGTYTLVSSGNISWAMMALKLCPTVACTDDTPTAAATNATVCAGGSITITATGYETGATFQWQKQNASTSVWENIDGATSDTYTVTTAAAEHAGNYHIVATKTCARTSNTVTIAVPSAPVFNSFTTTRRIMETQALSISDVSATDAVSYTWYKSTDATWDAGDTEIGDSRSLLKPYDGEAAGSTYYVICRAANSCGTTTSTAITVTVQTLIEEDCAIVGNSGEHNTFAKTGSVSSGTYGSIAELHTNSNNKYIYYTAESGYYFATATVNACVGNASDLPTAAYSYSTDGGANWTDQNLTGMTTAYADHVINLPANVNAFRVGRRLGDCGISSNTIYIHQVCFTYNENCTKTTVDPSSSTVSYTIGDSFTEPTFTVKSSGVALSPQPTITYTSSDETVATVDDDGTVNFQDKAGTVVITAAYAGDATYCDSEGSYTITVSCSDEAPKIIAADGTNIGGCNDNITLEAKKQNGTSDFSDGTYQWYRDGEAISGATDRTYTVSLTGVYSVERTSVGGCVSPSSNKATVTSESAEPEVERLTPFQYYHLDSVYRETSIMRFRHLFAVKNAGTTLEGKHFKMELSRNGGAASDVTNSNAFVMSADTVLLDMNKLYGKYEEDDELVLTCSAVDCEGNVSSIYKNTITIYVIDETPTLALICSGASGDGTRKTSNLVVGGDFLTGYNKADLCVQTGNTSFDKTQEWVLYTRLKENYIVTPVNGYAEFNKLNYEPFDILFLTDYPKASKSDAAATILDDMADLCDYRPLFTFKTHMVHKSPSKWAAKGFMAQPEVPKQSRLRLNIVCYAHPMFDDLKEVSDHIQKDANDHSQIVYTMLTGPGHEGSKGMQGFPIDAAEGFVTIGLVHDDATAADDTPSEGYVTWTSGDDDVMLVAAAERQVNLEARMILFSINCGAQSKLTETGRQVVLKSLEYLLSDATITPVADCSFTFTNGAGNDWTYEQYKAKCPACTGTIGDGKWSTAGNWGPDWILQPGKDTEVKIAAPVTVDMPHAKVRTVRILEGGSIDIPVGSGLEVKSTIRRMDGTEIYPTEENDIHIGSASTGNGTLIFNNNSGDTKARVDMYSNAQADVENMSAATSTWQYIGTPHSDVANARYNYYNSWLYQYDTGTEGWIVIPNGGPLVPFRGYCVTHPDAGHTFVMNGTLAATGTVDIDIPAGKYVVVANSWVAPIDINTIEDDDMEGITDKSIYFFNTGSDTDGSGTSTVSATGDARWAAGTYVSVPIHSAPYTDGSDDHIPSMQGFYVVGGSSDGALHLDYDKHVRGQGRGSILSGRMHAPRRTAAESDEPNVLKIFARGSRYDDRLIVLEREDFTRGYDSGWDGEAWGGSDLSPMVYVTGDGREDAVSAIPEFEGTVVAFKAGEDSEYRFEFTYSEDAEPLYLFDTENNTYTQIMTGNAYYFTTADKAPHSRFILTRQAPQVTTGCEYLNGSEGAKAKKLIIEDKMYIMLNGALYDATGKAVK